MLEEEAESSDAVATKPDTHCDYGEFIHFDLLLFIVAWEIS